MAYKIVPSGPRPAPSTPTAPNATPSSTVSKTRGAIGKIVHGMWNRKWAIAGVLATGLAVRDCATHGPMTRSVMTLYTPPYTYVVDNEGRPHISHTVTAPAAVLAVHADMGPNEAEWITGFQLLAQADAVDAEWMSAIGRSDHTRDAELADRRTSLTRSCLDHYALSLNKRSDETWVQVIERHSSMDLRRVRQVALSLWRLNELEQARAIMRLYFRDGRWRGLSDAIDADDRHALCDGLELALRDNMIPWNEFSEEDRAEFTRRCPDTINLRVPNR